MYFYDGGKLHVYLKSKWKVRIKISGKFFYLFVLLMESYERNRIFYFDSYLSDHYF